VLFEGRVGAPEMPGTEPEVPLLDAVHSDSDFWSNNFYVNPIDPPEYEPETETEESSSSSGYIHSQHFVGALLIFPLGFVLS
jgi:hypothetical protein